MHTLRYSAFISYRHADNTQEGRRWAEWLHRALERYVVPPDLIGTPNLRGEPVRDSLYPIFRDEDELPANADLATGIRAALEVSDHLIVLCSPRSAVSPWVRKEVREFKELGRSDRILAIIIAGEPNADDPAKAREGIMHDEECFCEELRFGAVRDDGTLDWTLRTEPFAADLRPLGTRAEGFNNAEAYREHLTLNSSLAPDKIALRTESYRSHLDRGFLRVVAGLLGLPLGQLADREAAHRAELAEIELARIEKEASGLRAANRRLAISIAAVLMLVCAATWLWIQAFEAKNSEKKQRLHTEAVLEKTEAHRRLAYKMLRQVLYEELNKEDSLSKSVTENDDKHLSVGAGELSFDLTIVPGIQTIVSSILDQELKQTPVKRLSAVLMDPLTGDILAVAEKGGVLTEAKSLISHQFEPGSLVRYIPLAAALDAGIANLDTPINCEHGYLDRDGVSIRDNLTLGVVSTAQVIVQSSNVGLYKLAQAAGPQALRNTMIKFGFGVRTGIELPFESPGLVLESSKWEAATLGRVALGHNFTCTSIQLSAAMAMIANGGHPVTPRIVKAARFLSDGRVLSLEMPIEPNTLAGISEQTAQKLAIVLEKVVAEGTGRGAKVPGVKVAGTTGTIRMYDSETKGFYRDRYLLSFIGFAPANDPRVVCLVIAEDPKVENLFDLNGGKFCGPIFARITREILAREVR